MTGWNWTHRTSVSTCKKNPPKNLCLHYNQTHEMYFSKPTIVIHINYLLSKWIKFTKFDIRNYLSMQKKTKNQHTKIEYKVKVLELK
jgi:hypothetical protein